MKKTFETIKTKFADLASQTRENKIQQLVMASDRTVIAGWLLQHWLTITLCILLFGLYTFNKIQEHIHERAILKSQITELNNNLKQLENNRTELQGKIKSLSEQKIVNKKTNEDYRKFLQGKSSDYLKTELAGNVNKLKSARKTHGL